MSAYAIVALVVLTLFIPVVSFMLGVWIGELSDDGAIAAVVFVMGCAISLAHLVYIL